MGKTQAVVISAGISTHETTMTKNKHIIFDTTLRAGKQSPGVLIARDKKIRISCAGEAIRPDLGEV
jgi:hypothetical protein